MTSHPPAQFPSIRTHIAASLRHTHQFKALVLVYGQAQGGTPGIVLRHQQLVELKPARAVAAAAGTAVTAAAAGAVSSVGSAGDDVSLGVLVREALLLDEAARVWREGDQRWYWYSAGALGLQIYGVGCVEGEGAYVAFAHSVIVAVVVWVATVDQRLLRHTHAAGIAALFHTASPSHSSPPARLPAQQPTPHTHPAQLAHSSHRIARSPVPRPQHLPQRLGQQQRAGQHRAVVAADGLAHEAQRAIQVMRLDGQQLRPRQGHGANLEV